jgi:hypothetical protein
MAYSGTPTVSEVYVQGRRHVRITLAELEAAAASEATIPGIPVHGTIVAVKATKTAGSAASIDPVLGRAASFAASTQDHIWSNGTAAAHINESGLSVRYYAPTGTLYVRSTAASAADNTVESEILILDGWV